MLNKLSLVFLVMLMSCGLVLQATAQSLPKDKQAEVVFELRLNKLRESSLMGTFQEQLDAMQAQAGVPSDMDIKTIKRVFGAMSLPDTAADLAAMQMENELRMEFFARVEFVDAASADAALAKLAENAETEEKNGKTYYKPPADEDAPQNMRGHLYDSKTIEFATDFYLEKGTGNDVFSSGLSDAWDKAPDHAFRIAIDLDNSSDLINEVVEDAKANAPPMMGGFIELIRKAKDIRLSFDLSSKNLLVLAATGNDDDQAEELRKGLDGIMGMAKMSSQQMMPMLEQQDEAAAKVVGEIIDSLAATRDGSEVQVAIAKPDGFEEAIKNMIKNLPGGGDF